MADKKSQHLYDFIDSSSFGKVTFKNNIDKELRSRMNVPFTIDSGDKYTDDAILEDMLKHSHMAGFCGLRQHRSSYGVRPSNYNTLDFESIVAFTDFVTNYMKTNGQQFPYLSQDDKSTGLRQ